MRYRPAPRPTYRGARISSGQRGGVPCTPRVGKARSPCPSRPWRRLRVPAITALFTHGVPLAEVPSLAGQSAPRRTRLYARRQEQVTRRIVERISG
jgi:hypothetical protein